MVAGLPPAARHVMLHRSGCSQAWWSPPPDRFCWWAGGRDGPHPSEKLRFSILYTLNWESGTPHHTFSGVGPGDLCRHSTFTPPPAQVRNNLCTTRIFYALCTLPLTPFLFLLSEADCCLPGLPRHGCRLSFLYLSSLDSLLGSHLSGTLGLFLMGFLQSLLPAFSLSLSLHTSLSLWRFAMPCFSLLFLAASTASSCWKDLGPVGRPNAPHLSHALGMQHHCTAIILQYHHLLHIQWYDYNTNVSSTIAYFFSCQCSHRGPPTQ